MKRVESLDYLRGAMAVSVMLYHYISWSFETLGGETFLGKLGVYAVSIFYILSGLSLAIVYDNRITKTSDIFSFLIKRIFRIFPLFWLAVTASLFLKYLVSVVGNTDFEVSFYTIFLNYSLLFGFFEHTAYLSIGAWSIGNEMVFYSIFPVVFFLNRKKSFVLPLVIIFCFMIGFYFSSILLSSDEPLSKQWAVYINPFNQIFLFMAGVAIGKWGSLLKAMPTRYGWALLGITTLLFVFFPAHGDKVQIVTGAERWFFSILSISLVLLLFVLNPKLSSWRHKIFSFLGQGCYSIYLLHPIVAIPVVFVFAKVGVEKPYAYSVSVFLTLGLSWVTFKYIESPMMNYGKKLTNSKQRKTAAVKVASTGA
jgi:peptidoglycan/LPS O-acetylase OafA/YrhL